MLYFKYSIVILFSLSLLFILTGYLRLLRFYYAAKKMQEVRHKLLKQIVLRFTNCCRLNIAICNTGVFVKKYIADYSVAGFHYHTFLLLSNLFTALGIGVNFAGVFLFQADFYPYVIYSVLYCILYLFVCGLFDLYSLSDKCATLVTDYLDNTLRHRLSMAESSALQAAPAAESPTQNPAKAPEVSDKNAQSSKINDTNSDEIIFSVINDFLI